MAQHEAVMEERKTEAPQETEANPAVKMLEDGTKPTRNNCGYEMACETPILDTWVKSFDGEHPLLDVGCCYGINSLAAAERGATVVALDMTREHLDVVDELALKQGVSSRVSTVLGKLPDSLSGAPQQVSGILVSEVLHFLTSSQVEASLRNLAQLLVPGGTLAISCANYQMTAGPIAAVEGNQFIKINVLTGQRMKAAGKVNPMWPGERFLGEFLTKEEWTTLEETYHTTFPRFFQGFRPQDLSRACTEVGLQVVSAEDGQHPGYPVGLQNIPNTAVFIVARKPKQ